MEMWMGNAILAVLHSSAAGSDASDTKRMENAQ